MPKALTHDQFLQKLSVKQPALYSKFTIIGEYENMDIKLLVRCNDCGLETYSYPKKLIAGSGCQGCRRLNNEKYFTRLFLSKPDYRRKFNYTGSVITSSHSPITFTCNDCGYICNTQTARTHYEGNGCPSCNNRPSFDKNLLVKRSIEKFGNIFDFTKTEEFSKSTDKILIGCPRHGLITTTAQSHLRTQYGCHKCDRYDAEEVSEKFYSNPNNSHIKFVDILQDLERESKVRFLRMLCPSHGEYSTRLSGILRGNGCLKCYHERSEGTYNKTIAERHKEEYLNKFISIYVLYIENLKLCKIGLSKNIKHRLACLSRSTNSKVNILYEGKINSYDAITLERDLLNCLSEYRGKSPIKFGGYTELLDLSEDMVSDLIQYLSTLTEECND